MTFSLISRAVSHGDDQPGPDLAEFDAVGDVHDAVEHAQAGVAEVVDGRVRVDAESAATGQAVAGSNCSRQTPA